ncbi:MAG: class I SAM-dependent methyltransferase [Verrucomicrobia bacterium]|nr:class I SAM-dependent methyltransferase [Verrucomicrobiota bacterium]
MAQTEGVLWWYRALHRQVAEALAQHPHGTETRVVDAGCGTGGLLLFLRQRGYRRLSGFDVSEHAVRLCRERGLAVARHDLRRLDQAVGVEGAEAIISNDTLYFLTRAEQGRFIQACWEALAPGGLLILNLPALAAFRGLHDLSVGIRGRFSRSDVTRLLDPERFEVIQALFWPFLLSPLIYGVRLLQRWRLRLGPQQDFASDVRLPPRWLNQALEAVTQFENRWLPWKPFGSSLFVVSRKRG